MRLAGKEKRGYYPTPPRTLYAITSMLAPAAYDGLIRGLDPCAGKGAALDEVTWGLRSKRSETGASANVMSYAVEPAPARYEACLSIFGRDQTLNTSWEETTVANQAFSFLYLNPPYDWEAVEREEEDGNEAPSSRRNRLEYNFLRETMHKLQAGGLLIFIVPHKILGIERVARTIANNFEDIRVYSLPDGEYEAYSQCVLFAYRRDGLAEDEETTKELMKYGAHRPPLINEHDAETGPYIYKVPLATLPQSKMVFRRTVLTYEQTAALVYNEGASFTTDWQRLRNPPPVNFKPVIRLRTGHIGPLISSGQLGTVNLGDKLIRGAATKEIVAQDEYGQVVEKDSRTCKTWTERFSTKIYCLDKNGRYSIISKPDELRLLLEQYGPLLHEIVQERYPPLYTGPTAQEWKVLSGLMPRKKLPGRQEAGLLTAQKHVVAAICRVLRDRHAGIIVGEMGTGKGPMQLAAAELMEAYPLAIATPAHMLEKFYREALDTIPKAKPVIVSTTAELDKLRKAYKPGDKLIVIASYESWKEGPGKKAQAMHGTKLVDIIDPNTKIRTGRKVVRVLRCPKCGGEVPAGIMKKRAKPRKCEAMRKVQRKDGRIVEKMCGEKLWQYGPLKKWPLARYVHEQMPGFFKMAIFDEIHKTKAKGSNLAQSFQLMVKSVDYVLGGTGTLFGGKSTDLFFLLHRINHEVRKRFGFNQEGAWSATYGRQQMIFADDGDDYSYTTGKRRRIARVKELAGISPAIYAWVFEQVVFLKVAELGFQMPPYAEEIERMVMAEVQREQYNWLYSTLYERIKSGITSFSRTGMKEAMCLMSVFLQNCLSRPESGFRTERVFWKNPETGKHQPYRVGRNDSKRYGYTDLDDALAIWNLTDTDVDDLNPANPADQRGLFPDMLAREAIESDPTSEAEKLKTEPMDLYPVTHVGEFMPKERWLLAQLRDIISEGGTVLLYVRQTGKRNIQPRLLEILTKAGIRAVILPDGDARLREAWIQTHARHAQVMITNPKKVETGLDLVMFNHVIFYELDYSLFTMWQAMRRVWRLGQTKPVKIIIPIYADAMEAHALSIMANKFQAALLLYGEMGAGLAQEADVQDVMAELTQHILSGQRLSANGIESLMADSIDAEIEGAQATEGMLTPEEMAALFAELAENEEGNEGDEAETGEDEDFVDADYEVLDDADGFTTLVTDDTALSTLPIFAAMADLVNVPPTEMVTDLTPAMADKQDRPSVADDLMTIVLATMPTSLQPLETDFKQGDHVQLQDGRQGMILAIADEGYADVAIDDARYCLLVPLDSLALAGAEPAAEAALAAEVAPEAGITPALAPAKESGKRTPTIFDFWDFKTQETEGVTTITVAPKEPKKGKKDPSGLRQMDIFTTFLTTEPDFGNQAKPN